MADGEEFGEEVAKATLAEEEDAELREEEDFLIGTISSISETFSLMNIPLTKSPTGERKEEKTEAVCRGMFMIEEKIFL